MCIVFCPHIRYNVINEYHIARCELYWNLHSPSCENRTDSP